MTGSGSNLWPPALRGPDTAELERLLSAVEQHLHALGDALRLHDSRRIEHHAGTLREALTRAMDGFSRAARAGQVPTTLRRRLVEASGQVAVQRAYLLRASVALDSTMDVLLPRERPIVYDHLGRDGSAPFRH